MPLGAFRLNTLSAAVAAAAPGLALTFISGASIVNNASTFTSPTFNANVGDIIVYIVSANTSITAAAPALTIPSGFDMFYNLATGTQSISMRTAMFYQISTASGSRTVSSFSGQNRSSHIVLVYRPNVTLSRISFTTGSSQITTATPTNQTLTFGTMSSAKVAFAYGANSSNATVTTNVVNSTTTATRSVEAIPSAGSYTARLLTFEGSGFSGTSTISKTDVGTNSMFSTVMTVTDQVARTTTATWAMGAGTMNYSTNTQKFGSANASFTGTSRWGRLTVNPLDSTFYFNSDQTWTVEFWQRNGNTFLNSGQGQIFCIGDDIQAGSAQADSAGCMTIAEGPAFSGNKNAYIGPISFNITTNSSADIVVHKHYAFVCHGNGTASLFVDGTVRLNRVAFASTLNSRIISMGQGSTSNSQGTSWQFDELRVSNIARYNASFSVATAAFANNANTLALMHFDSNTTDSTT